MLRYFKKKFQCLYIGTVRNCRTVGHNGTVVLKLGTEKIIYDCLIFFALKLSCIHWYFRLITSYNRLTFSNVICYTVIKLCVFKYNKSMFKKIHNVCTFA